MILSCILGETLKEFGATFLTAMHQGFTLVTPHWGESDGQLFRYARPLVYRCELNMEGSLDVIRQCLAAKVMLDTVLSSR